jgi:DNA-binding Xre family transcriptional regulator
MARRIGARGSASLEEGCTLWPAFEPADGPAGRGCDGETEEERELKRLLREIAQRDLERQLRPLRRARVPKGGWLRSIRQAIGVPVEELARHMRLSEKTIFQLERSEEKKTLTLKRLEDMARALQCDLVYGIVPWNRSLVDRAEQMAERELWRKRYARRG